MSGFVSSDRVPGRALAVSAPKRFEVRLWRVVTLVLAAAAAGAPLRGDTITVCPSGCDTFSIAHAESLANEGDTIQLSEDTFQENGIVFYKSVTIQGTGTGTEVHGDGEPRDTVFRVFQGSTVTFRNLAIRFGHATFGGGLEVEAGATARLVDVRVESSVAVSGGGIHNAGHLELERTLFKYNSATLGGAVYSAPGSTLSMRRTRVTENQNQGIGLAMGAGVLLDGATGRIEESTIDLNRARDYGGGAAICGAGAVDIVSSTVSGNDTWGSGGGIHVCGGSVVRLSSSTVTLNAADIDHDFDGSGGGISGPVELTGTIVAGNFDDPWGNVFAVTAPDCFGPTTSHGYNVIGTLGTDVLGGSAPCGLIGDTTGNHVPADPQLGALADNGGATPTHALLPGSPARDQGDPGGCRDPQGDILERDQRRAPRVGRCDIGAFEGGAEAPLFYSGFESGGLLAWSASRP